MTTAQHELPGYDRPGELPWATRRLVLARDGYVCVCCDRPVLGRPYAIHLRKPRHRGGDFSPENLITVLAECGERISVQRDPADEARGYSVPPGDDPAFVPVAYRNPAGHAVAWLLPDGGRSFEPQAAEGVVLTSEPGYFPAR